MGQVVIRTPVPGYTGSVGALAFTDGRAVADEEQHAAEIGYCRSRGYLFPDEDSEPATESEAPAEPVASDLPRRNASADTWRTYAVEHGMSADEAASLSRDQLAERFTSSKEDEQ